ncbi:proline dehydrogenase family protein [Dongia deserti]|uniref:proline dehydrogenase family protein n=1 Tax=Dongia deserti TaxID=2268030 RepID=UPI000E65D53D|nr:proline dehydrogenase family protein [Dongia deserti]
MKTWQSWMIGLARSPGLARWMQANRATAALARRFVGGLTVEDGIETAKRLWQAGFKASLYYLGEYVADPALIAETVRQKKLAVMLLKDARLQVHLSVDPTQIGYGYDDALGERNALEIGRSIQQSSGDAPVLMLDMEDAGYVTRTLALRDRLAAEGIPVGQTLQASLKRTVDDVAAIIAGGGSVRLVKGAFADPRPHAFQSRDAIDENYLALARMMLSADAKARGFRPVFGTHDDALIAEIRQVADTGGWESGQYEFEMLYGVRTELQRQLREQGEQVRLYLPFGRDWWPYAVRRVGENPRNAVLLARALLSG